MTSSWLVARWFLGGELVGGETPCWRDDRIPSEREPFPGLKLPFDFLIEIVINSE